MKKIDPSRLNRRSLGVQFSGNGKAVYWYGLPVGASGMVLRPGLRVVVPTKMKDDGTVSLSIATLVEWTQEPHPDADKPCVCILDHHWLGEITEHCKAVEAAKVSS
jgi:hypothetical protein